MVALVNARHSTATAEVAGRIGKVFAVVITAILDWNDARITRKSLNRLTDRELDDIGLLRGDIDGVARQR